MNSHKKAITIAVAVGLAMVVVVTALFVRGCSAWRVARQRYQEIDFRAAQEMFGKHSDELKSMKAMLVEDAAASQTGRVWIGPDREALTRRGIAGERQDTYLSLLNTLPLLDCEGATSSAVFVLARTGWAGRMRGKAFLWEAAGTPEKREGRETQSLGDDGWFYLHYR